MPFVRSSSRRGLERRQDGRVIPAQGTRAKPSSGQRHKAGRKIADSCSPSEIAGLTGLLFMYQRFICDVTIDMVRLKQAFDGSEAAAASPFPMSRYHLIRVFRENVGLPPHAYLTQVRLRRARELLAAGEPIAAVAQGVGFADQSHLTRRFKGAFGITPGQFVRRFAAPAS